MATNVKTSRPPADTDVAIGTLVVTTISDATDTPVGELPPLYDAIDPDALDAVFFGRDTEGCVRFQYAGHTVTVSADRTVDVSPNN
jgi:hypothetical protein